MGLGLLATLIGLAGPGVTQSMASATDRAGTLHVVDTFSSPQSHGQKVAQAAQQAGFQGPIKAFQIEGGTTDTHAILKAMEAMNAPGASPQQFLAGLDSYAANKQAALVHAATNALDSLRFQGANNSAVNISRNQNKAEIVLDAWNFLVTDEANPHNEVALKNAIRAFRLSQDKIFSPNPGVSGPETLKLQQALIDRVSHSIDRDSSVRQAKTRYDQAVSALAGKSVSVVISSGNEGEVLPILQHSAFHRGLSQQLPAQSTLKVPPNFYDNPLSNGLTVTVGAVHFSHKPSMGAEVYGDSTPSPNVALFADGQLGQGDEHGTSFSAPVVAAGLAKEHSLHHGLEVRHAQAILQHDLATEVEGVPKPVISPARLQRFLGDTTF